MPPLETEALVLEARDYRESSLLVTLLTRDRGRLGAMAKGARRPKSNLSSLLQSFYLLKVRLSVRPSGGLATLISADLVARPRLLASDPSAMARIAYAGLFAEILAHSHENDPHGAELFDLASRFFFGLGETEHTGSYALKYFFALLAALGFGLSLPPGAPPQGAPQPAAGKNPRSDRELYQVDLIRGTLLEPGAPRATATPGTTRENYCTLSEEAVDALASILQGFGDLNETPVVVNRRVGRTLTRLVARLFETHLECRLKSLKFLEEMVLKE